MFAGSMCCKVGVVLARGATPAPVLRANPILPNAWWAAERRKARREEWKCWQRCSWEPNPTLTLNTLSATSCSPSQTSTPSVAVSLSCSLLVCLFVSQAISFYMSLSLGSGFQFLLIMMYSVRGKEMPKFFFCFLFSLTTLVPLLLLSWSHSLLLSVVTVLHSAVCATIKWHTCCMTLIYWIIKRYSIIFALGTRKVLLVSVNRCWSWTCIGVSHCKG